MVAMNESPQSLHAARRAGEVAALDAERRSARVEIATLEEAGRRAVLAARAAAREEAGREVAAHEGVQRGELEQVGRQVGRYSNR